MSQSEIAELFQVGKSTVEKLWRQWRTTGTLAAKPHAGGPPARLAALQDELRAWVRENPDARLDQLVVLIHERRGIATSIQALSRTLLRLGLRKKKTVVACERERADGVAARQQFQREMADLAPTNLVFVDESGVTTKRTPH